MGLDLSTDLGGRMVHHHCNRHILLTDIPGGGSTVTFGQRHVLQHLPVRGAGLWNMELDSVKKL